MSLSFCDLRANRGWGRTAIDRRWPLGGVEVARGDELGTFHMGSSVVLVGPEQAISWEVRPGATVNVGQSIGRIAAPSEAV